MNRRALVLLAGAAALLLPLVAGAHITTPVVLLSDRDALAGLLAGARRFFVREVRLSPEERATVQRETQWTAGEDYTRFYLGRDDQGRLVAAAVMLTEYTLHGPVRVAVGLAPDGRIRGVNVMELSEETYPWLKPLLDRDFTRELVGQDRRSVVSAADRVSSGAGAMGQLYGRIVVTLVYRAAVLYDVAVVQRGGAA
jgi:hypothetical protein